MIWRLTYCNKKGVEARIDIIKGNRTPIESVQGSGQPFTLSYKLDKNDKSGHIMTSSADIEIFETETFNIDDLKTSNETELKVEYFEDNVLTWSGFILPDFFSREIGSPNIVRMTASDRLTALKGVTLSDLPTKVSLRSLIELSLAQTGLSLGLVSQIQINQGSTNILDSEILSQRLADVRGRSVNCYDILMSIMVGTNSTIRQRAGQWQVYNKLEHELRTPTIFFDKVERGAIRTIQPVASSVGVYNEFGGGLNYPTNYDFSDNLNGWSAINGFVASIDNRQVDVYSFSGGKYIPSYKGVGDSNYVVNRYNNLFVDASSPYLKSNTIGVIYPTEKSFHIEVEVNATNVMLAATNTVVDFAIIIEGNGNTLSMDGSGLFNEVVGGKPFIHRVLFPKAMPIGGGFISKAATASKKVKGLAISPDENFEGYTAHIRIYGSGGSYQSLIHSVTLTFSSTSDIPKGNLYKTTQGSNFTKQHDIETTVFGDYITTGLNGYFYNYPIDDTSNLYLPNGTLSSPTWITVFDTTERPLLHHVSRQKSRLFSVAHDILKANINVESFDPLAVFEDCKGGKYVVVSARFDFLRSEVDVDLEQIAYDNTISKRDFIYSYFGEGEDTIKSIGAIAGGGGGTGGGGMTSEQLEMLTTLADWWKLDEENDAIYSEKSVYSLKDVSALGLGSEGGGGSGDFSRLDAWVDYNETKANWVLSALLGYDLHTRVNDLEASGGGSGNIDIATTGSGNAVTGVSLSGNTLTFAKSSTFALSTHTHTIANITGLQDALDGKEPLFIKNTAFNKNFGTTAGTVAQGNHLHTGVYEPSFTKNTAFNKNFGTVAGTVMQGNDSRIHSHSNKALLDLITQSNIDVLAKLSIVDGNIKVDTTLWATGGISALGLGSGGGSGGGGVDMLDSWANYTTAKANYYVPASLLVPFRNDTLSRLTSLESGSATSIVTTGSGNAITSLTKAGSVITATKGLTFALATHTHTIAQITGLQGALNLKATQSDITTAINGIEIGGRNYYHSKSPISYSAGVGGYFTRPYVETPNGFFILGTTTDTNLGNTRIYNVIKSNGLWTVKFKAKANGTVGMGIDACDSPIQTIALTTNWQTYELTFNVTNWSAGVYNFVDFGQLRYAYYWIDDLMVVKGNKATDWSPATEDELISSQNLWLGTETPITRSGGNYTLISRDLRGLISEGDTCTLQFDITTTLAYNSKVYLSLTQSINVGNMTEIYSKDVPLGKSRYRVTFSYKDISTRPYLIFYKNTATSDTAIFENLTLVKGTKAVWSPAPEDTQAKFDAKLNLTGGTLSGNLTAPTFIGALSGNASSATKLQTAQWVVEQVGSELVFKYNGVIKQRMLSNGTILATGGVTALATT